MKIEVREIKVEAPPREYVLTLTQQEANTMLRIANCDITLSYRFRDLYPFAPSPEQFLYDLRCALQDTKRVTTDAT